MSTAKRVVKNSVWLMIATIIMRLLSAFVVVLIARGLGTERFGQYSFAVAFVGFFAIISNFGFSSLLVRDVAKNKSLTKKYIDNMLTLKLLFGLVALIAIFAGSFFIDKPAMVIIAVYVLGIELVVGGFTDILRALFRAHEIMKFDAISQIIEKFLWTGLLLLVVFMNLTLVNVTLAILFSSALGMLTAYIFVRKKITKLRFEVDVLFWKNIIIQAWPFALMGLFSLINFKIDQVMLSFMKGDTVLGIYSAAYKIIDILAVLPSLLLTVLYPVFSRFDAENKALLKKSVDFALRYVILLSIPVVIGVFLLADKIILLLYGVDYIESIGVLKILIFISLISFVNSPFYVLLNAIGKQKITLINTAFTALVNIIMNLILIPKYSINGAAFATIISEITFLGLSYYQLRKAGFKLDLLSKATKPIIAGIFMTISIIFMIKLNIFIIIPVAAIVYFAILFAIKEFSREDIELVKKVLKRNK
jgi:O-antigen/teichoic acid export membrane protein